MLYLLFATCATFALALVLYLLVEKPALHLRALGCR